MPCRRPLSGLNASSRGRESPELLDNGPIDYRPSAFSSGNSLGLLNSMQGIEPANTAHWRAREVSNLRPSA